jgi:DNA-binding SARP family transcriptional activator/tetratricopeptide (TPR) repeat protein
VGETASATDVQVSLLGGFSLAIAGQPVPDPWRLRKAKTLVKLLGLAPRHRLHRDVVAERLWPDADPEAATNNLHQTLHHLRRKIGPTLIAFVDGVVVLCPTGRLTVDVDVFEQAATAARRSGDIGALRHAHQLWTGPLLPEDQYADWTFEDRERLGETHAAVATLLGAKLSQEGEHQTALAVIQPLASTRPLDEHLQRVLIVVLAGLGRRWEAIEAYERLRDVLEETYAAEPEPQTKALYRRLLTSGKPLLDAQLPGGEQPPDTQSLVGRQPEWERLWSSWQRASAGDSHLFLITGEAGIGKTHLAEELLTWADQQGIATARTRSYGAEGRLALAPVTEWLRSDDIRQTLGRLADVWLTEVARLVPELLAERPNLPHAEPMTEFGHRQRFFEALARAVLAAPQPLLLLIDDLQWCDQETLQWLHFLLRFDPRKRLLVIGTARQEELLRGHPVAEWLVQLRGDGSVIELALDPLDAAETAQLAMQVTKGELDDESALRLYRETEGNPLFVMEMATAGLSTADIERSAAEDDLAATEFSTANLPPRMYAVIAARLAQLSSSGLELVGLAATVGREFTVETLRMASEADEGNLMLGLDELWQRRIVRSVQNNSFDFSHDKIRDVAYAELNPMRQRYWHLRVAQTLERSYAGDLDPVGAQLAAHYEQAGEVLRAVSFYQRAAEVTQRVYAYEEATGLLRHGLRLLNNLPDRVSHKELQLNLLRLLSLALVATHGYGAPEVLETLSQAQMLNEQLGKPPDPLLLRAAAIAALTPRKFQQGLVFGDQLLQLGDQQGDPTLLVEGHYVLGVTLSWAGSFTRSRVHLEQALAHYDPTHSASHIARYSQDPGVICRCRLAFDLWCLGYVEEAQAVQNKGRASAELLGHPFSLAYALIWDGMLQGGMGNLNSVFQSAEAVLALSAEHHLGLWFSWATVLRGWALAEHDPEQGIAELQRVDKDMRAKGAIFLQPFVSLLVAESLTKIRQFDRGLDLVNEALPKTESDRYWCDADLHRLRGDLLLAQGVAAVEVEAAFRQAMQIAQKQQAKLFELRAATSLARLWLNQGRSQEAHSLLTPIYEWFTEGLETPDLENARALLEISLPRLG